MKPKPSPDIVSSVCAGVGVGGQKSPLVGRFGFHCFRSVILKLLMCNKSPGNLVKNSDGFWRSGEGPKIPHF